MIHHHTCPACEFERGTSGHPIVTDEQIKCLDCGNSWKEFSGTGILCLEDKSRENTMQEMRRLLQQTSEADKESEYHYEKRRPAHAGVDHSNNNNGALSNLFLAVVLAVMCMGMVIWWLQSSASIPGAVDPVIVSSINLKEQIGRGGRKIITVGGVLENTTRETRSLPKVAIVLRKKNGGELVRWNYSPPNGLLKPGVQTRFSSSIQYDTPSVSYVEAIIE